MQIPDEIRKCVAFVGRRKGDEDKIVGTGFFVGVPIEGSNYPALFFVTARHVVDSANKVGEIYLRVNKRDGQSVSIFVPAAEWYPHPDPDVDVVAMKAPLLTGCDYRHYPSQSFATDGVIASEGIGIGEEVFVPGMFLHHQGRDRNIPIVRSGTIAAMSEEPIWVTWDKGKRIEALLIDCISTGGLSGSPVFVYLDNTRATADGSFPLGPGAKYYLLGLVHGHCTNEGEASEDALFREQKLVNAGIAIVVPASKIAEFFETDEMKAVVANSRRFTLPTEVRTAHDSVWPMS
jgi:hypothetical protein